MISNCGTFLLTSHKEVKYNESHAWDRRNVITKVNPQYMTLVTVDFMHQAFLANFASYTLPSFLQPSAKGIFFFYQPTLFIS